MFRLRKSAIIRPHVSENIKRKLNSCSHICDYKIYGRAILFLHSQIPPDGLHFVVVGGGLAGLNDLTGYAGGDFMFLVGPSKPDRT